MLTTPKPEDAEAWFEFLIAQQSATYAGIVPGDFAERQQTYRAAWVPELAAGFADPGTGRALVAKVNGELVGIAAIDDAPADWEVANGLTPAPAARQLNRLYVAPEFHGTGLADALFTNVDDGRPLYLWLIDGNDRAQKFYARRGFSLLPEQFHAGPSWGDVGMHRMLRSLAR